MTIIKMEGDLFWIETFDRNVTFEDTAGQFSSVLTTLEKAGEYLCHFVAVSFASNQINSQVIGTIALRTGSGGVLNVGDNITDVQVRFTKQAGSGASSVTFRITLFMRRPAR